jgi:hypothetical protein
MVDECDALLSVKAFSPFIQLLRVVCPSSCYEIPVSNSRQQSAIEYGLRLLGDVTIVTSTSPTQDPFRRIRPAFVLHKAVRFFNRSL